MNKDDQELFSKMKLSNVIQKRNFIMFLMPNPGTTAAKIVNRASDFIEGKIAHYGYFKLKGVPKYRLAWASNDVLGFDGLVTKGQNEQEVEVRKKVITELEAMLKIAKKMTELEGALDDFTELSYKGEVYFHSPKLKDSIYLSIFNIDPEKAAIKKYTSVKTPDDLFRMIEKMVEKSTSTDWSDGMFFVDEFKLLINQMKNSAELCSWYTEE